MIHNNISRIILGFGQALKISASAIIQNGSELIDQKFLKNRYITREEYENLKLAYLDIKQKLENTQKDNNSKSD